MLGKKLSYESELFWAGGIYFTLHRLTGELKQAPQNTPCKFFRACSACAYY